MGGGRRVAVDGNEPSRGSERGEDRPRMPAAAERGVDVDAGRRGRKRCEGFGEEDGDVTPSAIKG
jgi:hypothetical protein